MKQILFFSCFPLMLVLSGCKDNHTPYCHKMLNNAYYDIYVGFGLFHASYLYPDTLFAQLHNYRLIKSRSYKREHTKRPLEENVTQTTPSDTVSIFYFHADTVNKYTWENIQRDYRILRRYDLSLQDIIALKNKNGIPEIPYPPDERMKNMKMYPPYGK